MGAALSAPSAAACSASSSSPLWPFSARLCTAAMRSSPVRPACEAYSEAGTALDLLLACRASAWRAASMSGNKLAYCEGSASDSAALGFTFRRSSRHSPTISVMRLGRYVREKKAASGMRPAEISRSTHSERSPSRKRARKATLRRPAASAEATRARRPATSPRALVSSSSPDRSLALCRQRSATSRRPEVIASSPSCFHLASVPPEPAAMSRAVCSSPSCTASSNR
mmetsp:Transcript_1405/g.4189  ORF Transcript_1405/g.4189 Transcript_1405/m.4189 type:complete len:227 (-) Transcript_1405:2109-2789(-)